MNQIRDLLRNPATGWTIALIAVACAVWMLIRSFTASAPYDPARTTQEVTIRFTDTGDEVKMSRGRFEKELRGGGRELKLEEGIINPKTGKPTGFLVAADEWKETVERLNLERSEAQAASPWGAASTPVKK